MKVVNLLIGAVVGAVAINMFCQVSTSGASVAGPTQSFCANANGSIPNAMLIGAAVGAVVGGLV